MKKILLLGASYAQIPAIRAAKARGLYVITCDYLPDNPGHRYADEYHHVSTTDMLEVESLAERLAVDYVMAYASDPAAPVAAYVSGRLGLPGNTYKSVECLSRKDLFRELLADCGLNVPGFLSLSEEESVDIQNISLEYPVVVKPVDSSGSKGVRKAYSLAETKEGIQQALLFSRIKRLIIEEFVDSENGDLHGDGFVVDGELRFCYLGDHIYGSEANPYNPTGTLWPSDVSFEYVDEIRRLVQEIITKSGFGNGPINIEARIDRNGDVYIMEIGPRSGGHFLPQIIRHATGFDMVEAALDVLQGNEVIIPEQTERYIAYYAIHSDKEGILKDLSLDERLRRHLLEFHQYVKPGDLVKSFTGANAAVGVLLMLFDNRLEMASTIIDLKKFIKVELLGPY